METPFIEASSLTKDFGQDPVALSDVSFQISRGEFVSVVGPSGCGKSTLLRLVAGLIDSTEGALKIDGRLQSSTSKDDQTTAFVFQDANLLPWRTVIGNIRLPLELQARKSNVESLHIRSVTQDAALVHGYAA